MGASALSCSLAMDGRKQSQRKTVLGGKAWENFGDLEIRGSGSGFFPYVPTYLPVRGALDGAVGMHAAD